MLKAHAITAWLLALSSFLYPKIAKLPIRKTTANCLYYYVSRALRQDHFIGIFFLIGQIYGIVSKNTIIFLRKSPERYISLPKHKKIPSFGHKINYNSAEINKKMKFRHNYIAWYLFYRTGAPLRTEYEFLFRSLFKKSTIYRQVVEVLAKKNKGLTLKEIKEVLKSGDSGQLSKVLENLCKCDFIRKYSAYGKKEQGNWIRTGRNGQVFRLTCCFAVQIMSSMYAKWNIANRNSRLQATTKSIYASVPTPSSIKPKPATPSTRFLSPPTA